MSYRIFSVRAHFVCTVLILIGVTGASAQSSSFTYQGHMTDGGTAANGNYDLQFALWDSLSGGSQVGSTQTINAVPVSNGVFSVTLDFGANSFPGANRFLEISARTVGAGSFTLLTPRQQLTATPYAVRSVNAGSADGLSNSCNGCVSDVNIAGVTGSKLTGTIPVNAIPAGSTSYVQNTTNIQSGTNFNISGNGTAAGTLSGNIVNAATQLNLGGSRALAISGAGAFPSSNTFAGIGAGAVNTASASDVSGNRNSFFGNSAGAANTTGANNAFFGGSAGIVNTTGTSNSFFGVLAGDTNTTGTFNSYFGVATKSKSATASENAFFGSNAGINSTGSFNVFLGTRAASNYAAGDNNVFVGESAGNGGSGSGNTLIGSSTGFLFTSGLSGDNNTLLGSGSLLFSPSTLTNATAIGANASVSQSNSLVLGSINGVNHATADTNVGIGTTTPLNRLEVNLGSSTLSDPGISILGQSATGGDVGLRIKNTNAAGNEWFVDSTSNGSTYGGGNLVFTVRGISPAALIVHPSGSIELSHLGTAGGTALCLNGQNVIAACSSSLRYKSQVRAFYGGLNVINRLRPISFEWKQNHVRDIGLAAEEVNQVEPLLTFRNDKGEIEGVKYNQLSAVFINAFKEQQAQISHQQEQIERQQRQLREQQSSATLQEAEIKRLNSRLQAIERALRRRPSSRK